ncbi:hypothetical protein GCM10011496_29860 [Polaromonas eurypsychrophila]|uniref:Outer membrane lipoprotein n=1 Tax=Polaromonas eurypsychrophila TaxID=1614635 RepID=A0A916WKP2_9BURK|nr:hypothetical protein GCM10011496_29860 [Polaromonas eurypsychrophila]
MKTKIALFSLLVLASLAGCTAFVPVQTLDKTGIDALLTATKLPILSDAEATGRTVISEVVGYSCMNQATEPSATRVGATDQVKILAVQKGATAVSGLVCSEGGVSLVRNCWQSWECKGKALK